MLPRLNYLILYLGIAITIIFFYASTVRVECALCGPSIAESCSRQSSNNSGIHVSKEDNLLDVQNNTLGFHEVFAISLPERTDKRDALTLQSSLSGIALTIMDGVDSSKLHFKAMPHTMDQPPKDMACWRAHMNVIQHIVNKGISSALIMEDDADWDVALKHQLVQFARGSRHLLSSSPEKMPTSPYGDGWDFFWLGHCGAWFDELDTRRFVIPHDPTVIPPQNRQYAGDPDMSPWERPDADNRTRIVYKSEGGVCAAAYAVSLRGAQKILYYMSMLPYNRSLDWGFHDMCKDKKSDFNCIATYPALFGVHQPAGNTSKWSDIGHGTDESQSQVEERPSSKNLAFSARMNIGRLLSGITLFESQFPEAMGGEMDIADIGRGIGHPEVVPKMEAVEG